MIRKIISLLTLAITLTACSTPSATQRPTQSPTITLTASSPQTLSPSTKEKYIALTNDQDPYVALEAVKKDSEKDTILLRNCHGVTHEIGYVAYKKYKGFTEALRYHNEVCNSGYIHGIIESQFLNSKNVQEDMKTLCKDYKNGSFTAWECLHGLGHGAMYYTTNDLPKSLDLCATLETPFEKSSCINGIFMENFTADQKLHKSNYLKAEDPLFPCSTQAKEHKTDCFFYAPTYYLYLHPNEYAKALDWCQTAEEDYRPICISGVGSETMKQNISQPKLAEALCLQAQENQQQACALGMIGLYINHYGSLTQAQELCKTINQKLKQTCEAQIKSYQSLFSN